MVQSWRAPVLACLAGIAAALLAPACSRSPDPFEEIHTLARGETGRVVRVIDGDALVLSTGQSVRLIGVEAPAGPYRGRPGEPGFEAARRMLEDMALGRKVELRYAGLTRDRYDRALAHVLTADDLGPKLWLNAEMVRRGGARVRVYPDTADANAPLVRLEQTARQEKTGLWKERDWTIVDAANLPDSFQGFRLVQGTTGGMQGPDESGASCDVILERSLLVLQIRRSAAELCQLPPGTEVVARGYVRDLRMEITHPLNLERDAAS